MVASGQTEEQTGAQGLPLQAGLLPGATPAKSEAAPTPAGLPAASTQPCASPHLRVSPPTSVHRALSWGSADLDSLQSLWEPRGLQASAGLSFPTCAMG